MFPDPLGATALGGRLSEPRFVKSWVRPRQVTDLRKALGNEEAEWLNYLFLKYSLDLPTLKS